MHLAIYKYVQDFLTDSIEFVFRSKTFIPILWNFYKYGFDIWFK